jgi:GNAT superfamily N-acetyltransferase
MTTITHAATQDIPDLLAMICKLCAFHNDTCAMGPADVQSRIIDGPLMALMAHQNGSALGYAVLEPHWRPMYDGDLWDIAHLFVEETARGRGIGASLIAAAKDFALQQGACRLVIGTSPMNPGAAAAYRAMGLTEITNKPGPRFEIAL